MKKMLRLLAAFSLVLMSNFQAEADDSSPSDKFALQNPSNGRTNFWLDTGGLAARTLSIDAQKKTLVLLVGTAQSNWGNAAPTLYTPKHLDRIDQFNIYDGQNYEARGPLLGQLLEKAGSPYGPGNVAVRLADNLIEKSNFDRVILVPFAVGQTTIADWTTGNLSTRGPVAMRRLASKGITPATPGLTFARIVGIGESDAVFKTSEDAFAKGLATDESIMRSAGFVGRTFVCKETYLNGALYEPIRRAQAAAANNRNIFTCGDLDSLGAAYRNFDDIHWNDAGVIAAGDLVYEAIKASGPPF